MIYGNINNIDNLYYIFRQFEPAFEFMTTQFQFIKEGSVNLGNDIKGYFQEYIPQESNNLKFEAHKKFFDIQYMVRGTEFLGVSDRKGLSEVVPYDKIKDIAYYKNPNIYTKVLLKDGDFAIVSPDDAHMPGISVKLNDDIKVKKIVFKVPFK